MDDEVDKVEVEKRKFLYDFAKNVYSDEVARYKGLEDKAARYFGFLSILVGVITAFVRFSDHSVIGDLNGFLSWVYLVLTVFVYVAIANCGRLLFDVLKPRLLAVIDMTAELNSYYSGQKLVDIYGAVVGDLMEATAVIRAINKEKCQSIEVAHRELAVSLAFTVAVFVVYPFL